MRVNFLVLETGPSRRMLAGVVDGLDANRVIGRMDMSAWEEPI
jgi:hypothetical protein